MCFICQLNILTKLRQSFKFLFYDVRNTFELFHRILQSPIQNNYYTHKKLREYVLSTTQQSQQKVLTNRRNRKENRKHTSKTLRISQRQIANNHHIPPASRKSQSYQGPTASHQLTPLPQVATWLWLGADGSAATVAPRQQVAKSNLAQSPEPEVGSLLSSEVAR